MPEFKYSYPNEVCGFLLKAKAFPPSRHKSFFRLNGAVLSRHRSQNSSCREKIIVVDSIIKYHSRNGFVIFANDTQLILYAKNSTECHMWVEALRLAATFKLETFYHVSDIIGEGGFATVRVAYDRDSEKKVAVKTITKGGEGDQFMQREIGIMKTVNHRHVVETLDIFESQSAFHIVMEYLGGGSLYDLMEGRGRFPEQDVRCIARQILEGVAYFHALGIVHRDLKPENILMTEGDKWHFKIADFGLSNFYDECSGNLMRTILGTPQFVAPELVRNMEYGVEVDIWAVGMMVFDLLTGMLPFTEEEVGEKFQTENFEVEFNPAIWDGVSYEAMNFTKMLLCMNANRRLSAVGALYHTWLTTDLTITQKDRQENGAGRWTFRKASHAVRFVLRLWARAGLVATFSMDAPKLTKKSSYQSMSSLASALTMGDSEWDIVVQDLDDVEAVHGMTDAVNGSTSFKDRRDSEQAAAAAAHGLSLELSAVSPSSKQRMRSYEDGLGGRAERLSQEGWSEDARSSQGAAWRMVRELSDLHLDGDPSGGGRAYQEIPHVHEIEGFGDGEGSVLLRTSKAQSSLAFGSQPELREAGSMDQQRFLDERNAESFPADVYERRRTTKSGMKSGDVKHNAGIRQKVRGVARKLFGGLMKRAK